MEFSLKAETEWSLLLLTQKGGLLLQPAPGKSINLSFPLTISRFGCIHIL